MIVRTNRRYGVDARDRLSDATNPTVEGARAALESFYYAFNNEDIRVLGSVWSEHPLAQLNNPLGGIVQGHDAIVGLYERIFSSPVRVRVELDEIVEYLGDDQAVFVGRETGSYSLSGDAPVALSIRTTRYFRYDLDVRRWTQVHHHGSIDDAERLKAYQQAVVRPASDATGA